MHEETLHFERADDIAQLTACGALRGNVAQFAQPRGPDLVKRTEALDAWCALRAAHGVWQYARAVDGAPGPEARVRDEGADAPPRRAVALANLPLARHEHRGYTSLPPDERDRQSKRNFYRIIDRFGWRRDLLVRPGDDETG